MRYWYQNLNESKRRLFHFRGSIGFDSARWTLLDYEMSSGPSCQFTVKIKPYNSVSLTIGLLFFTAYLTLPFFSFRKWISESRKSGFYFYHWALVWDWMAEEWESHSAKDPWWKHFYFHIDDFFLGRMERLEDDLADIDNVSFKLGEKTFVMNSIKWTQNRCFRRHIPYTLFHRTWFSVEMKIDKPPMHAGKGENSWDCDDDGAFGVSKAWGHERPTWLNREAMAKIAVQEYAENCLKDAARYGSGSGERGARKSDAFEYIGREKQAQG